MTGFGIGLNGHPQGVYVAILVLGGIGLFVCGLGSLFHMGMPTQDEADWATIHLKRKHRHTDESLREAHLRDYIRRGGGGGF